MRLFRVHFHFGDNSEYFDKWITANSATEAFNKVAGDACFDPYSMGVSGEVYDAAGKLVRD